MSLSHDHAAEVNANIMDNLRAENARLRERVEEAQQGRAALRIQFDAMTAQADRAIEMVKQVMAENARLQAALDEQKRITDSIINVDVAGLRKEWKKAESERDGYAAQSKLRGEALKPFAVAADEMDAELGAEAPDSTMTMEWPYDVMARARAAIAITPEQAREKEARGE